MNALKIGLLAGVAMLSFVGSSQALTASGGSITLTSLTDYGNSNALSGYIGVLSKFNSAAGTLTGVTFTVSYGFDSTITVTATTASTGNVSTESAAEFDSSDSGVKAVLNALVNNKPNAVIGSNVLTPTAYDLTGNKSVYTLNAGTSANYDSTTSATNTYNATASQLAAFVSTSTSSSFDVYGGTLTGLNLVISGGNAQATQSTTATQTISVMYTYDAAAVTPPTTVPEPASMALLGAGLIGAGLIRRKNAA